VKTVAKNKIESGGAIIALIAVKHECLLDDITILLIKIKDWAACTHKTT